MNLVDGVQLGKYRLIRRLAVGGMAELFLAKATGIEGFEKIVALKRILPALSENEDFVRMFLDEARLSAQLQHPNIAQVYDIGVADGDYFFTMEYVHGKDLRQLIRATRDGGGIPLEQALTIVLAVASGLHYAHERRGADGRPLGIVHRDISPSNVLVSFDGTAKLVDFGVAKARSHQAETVGSSIKGKIPYMAPEQCRGEPLDRRTDIFSLGILLYELVTNTRLFRGGNEYTLLQHISSLNSAPAHLHNECPDELRAILLRALQPEPAKRYQMVEELEEELAAFTVGQGLTTSSVGLRRYIHRIFPKEATATETTQVSARASQHALPPRARPSLPPHHSVPSLATVKEGGQNSARESGIDVDISVEMPEEAGDPELVSVPTGSATPVPFSTEQADDALAWRSLRGGRGRVALALVGLVAVGALLAAARTFASADPAPSAASAALAPPSERGQGSRAAQEERPSVAPELPLSDGNAVAVSIAINRASPTVQDSAHRRREPDPPRAPLPNKPAAPPKPRPIPARPAATWDPDSPLPPPGKP